ncbi:ABC transporter permease [Mycolicibacterium palauense]|uniref:ABC transporter permease n=1 Tax=Mycolicibacterium palauense TaxID=2034511 RepID=UPI000BFEDEF5|nr:ABC transporter permease subunit [Mycolicibacterium palauense]
MLSRRTQSTLYSCAGAASLILLWAVGGSGASFIAPIGAVLRELPQFVSDPEVWANVIETWIRVMISLALGLLVGIGVAFVMWRSEFWGRFAGVYVTVLVTVPSTITALMAVSFFRNVELGAIVVLVATIVPFVSMVVYSALRRIDPGLLEMAASYRYSRWQWLRELIAPQIAGSVMTAVRNEHAHLWKVVVIVEIFLVSSGMGFQFDRSFSKFNLVDVMLWLIVFAVILLATEYLVIRPLERRAQHWTGVQQ